MPILTTTIVRCPYGCGPHADADALANHLVDDHGHTPGSARVRASQVTPFDPVATLDAELREWAEANGWRPLGFGAWACPGGRRWEEADSVRQAITCDMQDRSPGVFQDLEAAFGDDVWRAVDGVPVTGGVRVLSEPENKSAPTSGQGVVGAEETSDAEHITCNRRARGDSAREFS